MHPFYSSSLGNEANSKLNHIKAHGTETDLRYL